MAEAPAPLRTFVLVGHCGPDMHLLKATVKRAVPGAVVVMVIDEPAMQMHLHADSVLLINRALEGDFRLDSGVELIREIAQHGDRPRMMLISNFPEAQDEAVAAGAQRGFGKTQLHQESTAAMLREAAKP